MQGLKGSLERNQLLIFFTPNESGEDHSEAESTILENQDRRINKILHLVSFVSVVWIKKQILFDFNSPGRSCLKNRSVFAELKSVKNISYPDVHLKEDKPCSGKRRWAKLGDFMIKPGVNYIKFSQEKVDLKRTVIKAIFGDIIFSNLFQWSYEFIILYIFILASYIGLMWLLRIENSIQGGSSRLKNKLISVINCCITKPPKLRGMKQWFIICCNSLWRLTGWFFHWSHLSSLMQLLTQLIVSGDSCLSSPYALLLDT